MNDLKTKALCDDSASAMLRTVSMLGLSGPPQKTDGLWKGLFWPSIENVYDADLAAARGFWIGIALAFVSVLATSTQVAVGAGLSINSWFGVASLLFFFLGAIGVREGSLAASASMLVTYTFETILYLWVSPFHFSLFRLVGLALLTTNMRAAYLVRKWRVDLSRSDEFTYGPVRQTQTLRDKFVDQMPRLVWPWGRAVFYALTIAILPLDFYGLTRLLRR